MKPKWFGMFLAVIAMPFCLVAAGPGIECSGVMLAGADSQVALAYKDKPPAQWVRMGEDFYGYRVKGFDEKTRRVGLESGKGQLYVLPLQPGAVVTTGKELPPGARAVIQNNLVQIGFAVAMYYQQHGRDPQSIDELLPLIPKLRVAAGENYQKMKLIHRQPLTVTTRGGIVVRFEAPF